MHKIISNHYTQCKSSLVIILALTMLSLFYIYSYTNNHFNPKPAADQTQSYEPNTTNITSSELHTKFDDYLQQLLHPNEFTNDVLSNQLITLFILKHRAPKVYNTKKLHAQLNKTISRIHEIPSKVPYILMDLQPLLDYWYFTKLLGYHDEYEPNTQILQRFISDDEIKRIHDANDAVTMYVYIRILMFCNWNKYHYLQQYIPILESKLNHLMYGYHLTHVILYDLQFGKVKDIPKTTIIAMKHLDSYCNEKLAYDETTVDLMAELLLMDKLISDQRMRCHERLVQYILHIPNTNRHFHEIAVLTSVSAKWN